MTRAQFVYEEVAEARAPKVEPDGLVVSLNTVSLENALLMREWGKWARNAQTTRLGFGRQPWVAEIPSSYVDDNNDADECLPDISDEYGMLIDRALLALDAYSRTLIVLYYQRRVGLNRIAKILHKSRQRIATDRDCALSALYGLALAESA